MIPKIRFRYSSIYDSTYRNSKFIKKLLKERNESYPSQKKILKYISQIKPIWEKQEKKIFKELSKITGLKWKEKEIICYVIGFGRGLSDPLTMKLYKNKNDFIDTLTHELIHQIQFQNEKKWPKWRKHLSKKYKKESRSTKSHISVHAINKKIYLRLFNKNRLKRDIKRCQKFLDYKLAWEVVEEEGHENIIKKFRELTK